MDVLGPATIEDVLQAMRDTGAVAPENLGIWCGFPLTRTAWERVRLTESDLRVVRLIHNEPAWREIGGPERSPVVGVEWVRNHPTDGTSEIVRGYHAMFFDPPPRPMPSLILVGPPDPTPDQLVVLDGNHRILAACMDDVEVEQIPFLRGTSPAIAQWRYYDDP